KEKILTKLYTIYYYDGNQEKLQETFNELRKINPDYHPVITEKKKYVYYLPVQVEDKINRALSLYQSRKLNAALDLFIKTLEIRETALANRCMGDILFSRNDSTSIVYYLKAYPDYKSDTDFLKNLCLIYIQQKQIDRAKSVLEEIRKLNPDSKYISLLEKYTGRSE
ncbi:tetratricopeptide repeat protein, partial [bacterium]|nr:tetratricopeptide repeat protein [bacterium]